MTERPDLSCYTTDTLTYRWGVVFAGANEYYVDESLLDSRVTRWGPIPSKELAYDLIQERRTMIEALVIDKIPALRAKS